MEEKKKKSPDDIKTGHGMTAALKTEIGFLIFLLTAALLFMVVLGSSKAMGLAVLLVIWSRILFGRTASNFTGESWHENAKRIIIFMLIAGAMQLFPPISVGARNAWRYPLIKKYVSAYNSCRIADWFPEEMTQGISDYKLGYMPSILQGTGYFTVCYAGEDAAEWESYGKENAAYIVPLADYIASDGTHFDPSDYAVSSAPSSSDPTLDVGYEKDFWTEHESDAVIYVIDTNLDSNHPRTEAVIVDVKSGLVQFYSE
jgi:hypothetical protein